MPIETIAILIVMGLMLIAVGFPIFFLIRSIRARREYEAAELPDLFEGEEEEILPDIEESSFSKLGEDFNPREESVSEIYNEIYGLDSTK